MRCWPGMCWFSINGSIGYKNRGWWLVDSGCANLNASHTSIRSSFRMSVRFGLRLAMACLALISLSKAGLSQTKVAIVSLQRAVLGCAEIKKASAAMEVRYKPRQQEMERL